MTHFQTVQTRDRELLSPKDGKELVALSAVWAILAKSGCVTTIEGFPVAVSSFLKQPRSRRSVKKMAETDFTELDDAYGEPAGQGNNTASKGYVLEPGIEVYPGATEKDIALLRRIGKHLSQSRECQDNE